MFVFLCIPALGTDVFEHINVSFIKAMLELHSMQGEFLSAVAL